MGGTSEWLCLALISASLVCVSSYRVTIGEDVGVSNEAVDVLAAMTTNCSSFDSIALCYSSFVCQWTGSMCVECDGLDCECASFGNSSMCPERYCTWTGSACVKACQLNACNCSLFSERTCRALNTNGYCSWAGLNCAACSNLVGCNCSLFIEGFCNGAQTKYQCAWSGYACIGCVNDGSADPASSRCDCSAFGKNDTVCANANEMCSWTSRDTCILCNGTGGCICSDFVTADECTFQNTNGGCAWTGTTCANCASQGYCNCSAFSDETFCSYLNTNNFCTWTGASCIECGVMGQCRCNSFSSSTLCTATAFNCAWNGNECVLCKQRSTCNCSMFDASLCDHESTNLNCVWNGKACVYCSANKCACSGLQSFAQCSSFGKFECSWAGSSCVSCNRTGCMCSQFDEELCVPINTNEMCVWTGRVCEPLDHMFMDRDGLCTLRLPRGMQLHCCRSSILFVQRYKLDVSVDRLGLCGIFAPQEGCNCSAFDLATCTDVSGICAWAGQRCVKCTAYNCDCSDFTEPLLCTSVFKSRSGSSSCSWNGTSCIPCCNCSELDRNLCVPNNTNNACAWAGAECVGCSWEAGNFSSCPCERFEDELVCSSGTTYNACSWTGSKCVVCTSKLLVDGGILNVECDCPEFPASVCTEMNIGKSEIGNEPSEILGIAVCFLSTEGVCKRMPPSLCSDAPNSLVCSNIAWFSRGLLSCEWSQSLCRNSDGCFPFLTRDTTSQPYFLFFVSLVKDVLTLVAVGHFGPKLKRAVNISVLRMRRQQPPAVSSSALGISLIYLNSSRFVLPHKCDATVLEAVEFAYDRCGFNRHRVPANGQSNQSQRIEGIHLMLHSMVSSGVWLDIEKIITARGETFCEEGKIGENLCSGARLAASSFSCETTDEKRILVDRMSSAIGRRPYDSHVTSMKRFVKESLPTIPALFLTSDSTSHAIQQSLSSYPSTAQLLWYLIGCYFYIGCAIGDAVQRSSSSENRDEGKLDGVQWFYFVAFRVVNGGVMPTMMLLAVKTTKLYWKFCIGPWLAMRRFAQVLRPTVIRDFFFGVEQPSTDNGDLADYLRAPESCREKRSASEVLLCIRFLNDRRIALIFAVHIIPFVPCFGIALYGAAMYGEVVLAVLTIALIVRYVLKRVAGRPRWLSSAWARQWVGFRKRRNNIATTDESDLVEAVPSSLSSEKHLNQAEDDSLLSSTPTVRPQVQEQTLITGIFQFVVSQEFWVILLSMLFQATFNYAALSVNYPQLGYFDVVVTDFQSRSALCMKAEVSAEVGQASRFIHNLPTLSAFIPFL